ncbi:MAG: hypothetical protein HKO59_01075 [Phycisphaerales bacterium]|nr:hypothetical protein [Phycisphaerae bacterium]NNF41621.1 hypothetical protein [Phycisphaerales bacterium]NNM24571.1 hypothetical protein [Phycisphaerales bacterium]
MNEKNFIPESYLKKRGRRATRTRTGLLLAMVAGLIVAWMFVTPDDGLERLERRRAALEDELLAAEGAHEDRAADAAAQTELQDLLALRAELSPAIPITWIVSSIASAMPPAMGLGELSLVVESGDGEEPFGIDETPGPKRVTLEVHLEGLAPDDVTIARFIGGLDSQPLFSGVELGFSRPLEGAAIIAREFQITASVALDRTFELVTSDAGGTHAD